MGTEDKRGFIDALADAFETGRQVLSGEKSLDELGEEMLTDQSGVPPREERKPALAVVTPIRPESPPPPAPPSAEDTQPAPAMPKGEE